MRDRASFKQILEQGRHRLDNSPTQEHAIALIEIANIAGHRFDDLVADANPIYSARTRGLDGRLTRYGRRPRSGSASVYHAHVVD